MASTTMTSSQEAPMIGNAGVLNSKLILSQGIERTLSAGSAGGNFDSIPIIDLSPLSSEQADPAALARLTADLKDACARVGFFVIRNHGIDWAIVERAFAALREFFAVPHETKMRVHQSKSASFMGYEEAYYTNVDRLKKGDLKESMTTGYEPDLDAEGAGFQPQILLRPNQWPEEKDAPLFKPAMRDYRKACLDLMRRLCKVMTAVLGVEEEYFDKKFTYPVAGIRALYYPPQELNDNDSTGLGAHTDVQFLTMIAQDPFAVQSLEVLNAAGQWIKPTLEPETFVVNLGDMMARLTNDVFQSTVHRVCNKSGLERYSLPFFFGLNNDELISPLPQFVSAETPLRPGYERPMTAYEHYNRRMQRAHHKHPTATEKWDPSLPKGMSRIDGEVVAAD